jgi:diguanylate cyclase (GGDEF)-like protein
MIEGGWVRLAPKLRRLAVVALLATAYCVAARLGLRLAFVNASATAVWPPTGIALTAVLLLGYDVWPGIFAGAFVANLLTAGTVVTSVGIAAGNTLEAIAGAFLVNRFANGRRAVESAEDILTFAFFAGVLATAISATIGVTTLSVGGFAAWPNFGSIWFTWWLGDAAGALVIAPALLLWTDNKRLRLNRAMVAEAVLAVLSLAFIGLIVFGTLNPSHVMHYPLEFLCIPVLLWIAYRFGQRGAATAIVALAAIAIWGTLSGSGPFASPSPNESLLLLQSFLGVAAVMSLVLGASVSERREVEARLRQLAVTDPLTGLANHRHLMHGLQAEIERSLRNGRGFAILLLDLDGLKRINDRHGHLVGSRALRRVANVLWTSCRSTDIAARFGGDEFVVILPESGESTARQVADRITNRLAADPEPPPTSVSIGVALFPRDGVSADSLIAVADRMLYDAKSMV